MNARSTYTPMHVKRLAPEVKRALTQEAAAAELTISDTALRALADYFGTDWASSGRMYRRRDGALVSSHLEIMMPETLRRCIWSESRRLRTTESDVVRGVLARRYGFAHAHVRVGRPRS